MLLMIISTLTTIIITIIINNNINKSKSGLLLVRSLPDKRPRGDRETKRQEWALKVGRGGTGLGGAG